MTEVRQGAEPVLAPRAPRAERRATAASLCLWQHFSDSVFRVGPHLWHALKNTWIKNTCLYPAELSLIPDMLLRAPCHKGQKIQLMVGWGFYGVSILSLRRFRNFVSSVRSSVLGRPKTCAVPSEVLHRLMMSSLNTHSRLRPS